MANFDLSFPGAAIDAILTTAYDLQNAGYIFKGSATAYSGTPTQRTWLLAPAGFSGYGFSSAIPKGSIGICKWNGSSWSGDLINVVTIDSYPTQNSTNAVSSGGMWQALDDLGDGIWATLQSFVIQDGTTSAQQADRIKLDVKMTDGQNVQHLISSFGILAATASKAGLMSAADKAKVDAFLDNLRSLSFTDTTLGADAGTKIVETLKATIGGTEETISTFQILAATASKAGLLSAADKAKLDALWSSGYQFAGIATPSTTPVSTTSKIFYIATEAGTYFNAVTVTQGINILSWDGSTWSAVQVVGIDDEPTPGSSNLIESGAVAENAGNAIDMPNHRYLKNNGTSVTNNNFNCSNFVKVHAGDTIYIKGYTGKVTDATVCGYSDESVDNFVSVLVPAFGQKTDYAKVTVPSGVNYIRVSLANENHPSYQGSYARLASALSFAGQVVEMTSANVLENDTHPVSGGAVFSNSAKVRRVFYYPGDDVLQRNDLYTLKPLTVYRLSYSVDTFPNAVSAPWSLSVVAYTNDVETNLLTNNDFGIDSTDLYFITPANFDFIRFGLRGTSEYSFVLEEVNVAESIITIRHTEDHGHYVYIPAEDGEHFQVEIDGAIDEEDQTTSNSLVFKWVKTDGTKITESSLNAVKTLKNIISMVVPSDVFALEISPVLPADAVFTIKLSKTVIENLMPYDKTDELMNVYSRLDRNSVIWSSPSENFWGAFQGTTVIKLTDYVHVDIDYAEAGTFPGIRINFIPDIDGNVIVRFNYKSDTGLRFYYNDTDFYILPPADEWTVASFADIEASNVSRMQVCVRKKDIDDDCSFELKDFSVIKQVPGSTNDTVEVLKKSISSVDVIMNKYQGKKISIIGDSVSTVNHHNAVQFTVLASDIENEVTLQGYPTYYDIGTTIGDKTVDSSMVGALTEFSPAEGDEGKTIGNAKNYNTTVRLNDVWWNILIKSIGAELLQNVSWSGSSISSHEGNNEEYKTSYAWHDATIAKLATRDEEGNTITPDVVIIYRGINDISHNGGTGYSVLTDFGYGTTEIPADDTVNTNRSGFKEAYALTIKKIREAYPMATIVCCTISFFKRNSTNFPGWPERNGTNTLAEFNDAIREVANLMGCEIIEFDKDGITWENCYPTYINDSETNPTHPNANGHKKMAEKAISDLL